MLSEKIEKYSDIADKEGIIFIWKCINSGVTSIEALSDLRIHNIGKINVNIDVSLELFQTLNLLDFTENKIKFTDFFLKNGISKGEDFIIFFTKSFLNFLLKNEYIDKSKIIFDITENHFVLLRNSIKYKHASLRNLLLSLSVIQKRVDGSYLMSESFLQILNDNIEKSHKMDEQKLFEMLELQRHNGEQGELFVLQYELNRLSDHKNIDHVKRISLIDVGAGYDIVSYNSIISQRIDRFIEVKTYTGKPHFFWSRNEISVAKLRSKNYFLYLVNLDEVKNQNYEPQIISDPSSYFENSEVWTITAQSFLYELN